MTTNNWRPREYERVPDLSEVDPEDYVAYTKAKHQWVRDRLAMSTASLMHVIVSPHPHRAVDLEVVKILRERMKDCQRREGVNHPQNCRDHTIAYMTALRKYQSEGQFVIIYSSS